MIVNSNVDKLFSFIMFSVDRKMRLEESDVSCGLEMLHSGSEIQMQLDIFFCLQISIDTSTMYII